MKFAITLTQRLIYTYGVKKEGVWFFPEPKLMATLQPEDLRPLQISSSKAMYIIGISKSIANKEIDLDTYAVLDNQTIEQRLCAMKGIGVWTAHNFLLFGMGRPNLFPVGDVGLQNALQKLFGFDSKPSQIQMLAWQKEWEPFGSYASMYLWRSLSE
jgi:DNA-3-methyladenine glycosylase II